MAVRAKKIQPAKAQAIEDAKKTFAEYSDFIFADYRGLTVEQITALRDKLREKNAVLKVVKNNFARIAFEDMKKKISDDRRKELEKLCVVSEDESAIWLIDYWCKKDVRGLIQMPFSRHWIMHIEACERIRRK